MVEVGAPDTIEKIISHWYKKTGLIFTFFLLIGITFFINESIIKNNDYTKYYPCAITLLLIFTWLIWLLSTKRIVLRSSKDLVVATMILVDDEEEVKSLYRISQTSIEKIKSSPELKGVKLIYLPANFLSSSEKVKKYVNNNSKNLDLFLILHVRSGNIQNDLKIEIDNFEFVYNLDTLPYNRSILFEKIDFISEIKFQNFHKKWVILNSNSFEDRAKIKDNFEDLLYHMIAIEYLLIGEHEKSLPILKKILQIEKTSIEIVHNNLTLNLEPVSVSQGRILHLLTTLYLAISDKYMYSNPQKTLAFLKDLEKLIPLHKYSSLHYIRMARMSYECGNVNEAIFYTEKAAKINPKDPTPLVNQVFFGILSEDWDVIYKNLREIFHYRKRIAPVMVDVIDFLCKESKKHPQKILFFNLVINFYETLFTNKEEGKIALKSFLQFFNEKNIPNKIMHLTRKVIDLK